jgi:hypothetical protein
MVTLRNLTLTALLVGALATANADNLDMQGTQPVADGSRPMRGMTAENVEARFGTPVTKVAPVGDPPIARWEYKDFVVFFEYDRVIHAVVKRGQSG